VKTHLRRYTEQDVVEGQMTINGDESARPGGNIEIALYRIFLELLNNTVKHSEATKVRVEFENLTSELGFRYFDNGKGFDPGNRSQSGGIGLLNIESRVNALRGKVSFRYENNEMSVQIKIPL
jgi:signal transduction histidine kinase